MGQLRTHHFENYQTMPSATVRNYYLHSELEVDVPVDNIWRRSGCCPMSATLRAPVWRRSAD